MPCMDIFASDGTLEIRASFLHRLRRHSNTRDLRFVQRRSTRLFQHRMCRTRALLRAALDLDLESHRDSTILRLGQLIAHELNSTRMVHLVKGDQNEDGERIDALHRVRRERLSMKLSPKYYTYTPLSGPWQHRDGLPH